MAKLEGGLEASRQQRQKITQQRHVRFQVRRQLKQHRPELRRQWLQRGKKSLQRLLDILQTANMRDELVRLQRKAEVRTNISHPSRRRFL